MPILQSPREVRSLGLLAQACRDGIESLRHEIHEPLLVLIARMRPHFDVPVTGDGSAVFARLNDLLAEPGAPISDQQ